MSVSVLMVRALVDELSQRGLETHSLLQAAGLGEGQLSDLSVQLDSAHFEAVAEQALQLSGDPALGLAVGANVPERNLQILGYLLLSATSLRSAYEHFRCYQGLLAAAPHWELIEEGASAGLVFTCSTESLATTRLAHDWALSLAYRMLRCFAPREAWSAIILSVAHERPDYAEQYARYLGCEVQFADTHSQLRFPQAWLDLPQIHGDLMACDVLRASSDELLRSQQGHPALAGPRAGLDGGASLARPRARFDVGDRLRARLREADDLAKLDVPSLARMVNLSASSLRRVLAEEGLTPLRLLDEARCRVACTALKSSDSAIKTIALRLGYADVSSFHRAFIRWTGRTPAEFRNGLRAQRAPGTQLRVAAPDA